MYHLSGTRGTWRGPPRIMTYMVVMPSLTARGGFFTSAALPVAAPAATLDLGSLAALWGATCAASGRGPQTPSSSDLSTDGIVWVRLRSSRLDSTTCVVIWHGRSSTTCYAVWIRHLPETTSVQAGSLEVDGESLQTCDSKRRHCWAACVGTAGPQHTGARRRPRERCIPVDS